MTTFELLDSLLKQRILILDGAMGTTLQRHKLGETDYRGVEFLEHLHDLLNNNDVLSLTQPHLIADVHRAYLEAGADIIETNTFQSNAIDMGHFGLEDRVYDLNLAGARLACRARDEFQSEEKPRFVAGAMGPLTKTLSLSPEVNDPAFRAVDWDQVVAAYREQARGLLDGGVDILLVETTFDTLNLKAALFAIQEEFDARGYVVPIIASGTITDASGRTLSGQTLEAFWTSISGAPLFCVGLNCALGPDELRQYVEEFSRLAPIYTHCYANAGLPDPLSETGFPETPSSMALKVAEWAANGWLNILGGCCGTTPPHIKADGPSGKRVEAARAAAGRSSVALQRFGNAHAAPGKQFYHGRRAHQRDRFAEICAFDSGK